MGEHAEVAASHWAVSRGGDTLLRGTIPKRVFDDLVGKGLVKTGSVPGLRWFPHETVFMPRALPVLNRHINWRIDRLEL